MRSAYVISAYRRPDLLDQLLLSLEGRPSAVHIDRKSESREELEDVVKRHAAVSLLPQHVCHWGMFGHVAASLEGLKWFRKSGAEYCFLLTGQCHPLYSVGAMESALDAIGGGALLQAIPFPRKHWMAYGERGGFERIEQRYEFKDGGVEKVVPATPRRIPGALAPYGGSGYWGMHRRHVDYVLRFLFWRPSYTEFFRSVFIPDEIFFQTILANSGLRKSLVSWSMHYLDWSDRGPSPGVMDENLLAEAAVKKKLFARKFESVDMMRAAAELAASRADSLCRDWAAQAYQVPPAAKRGRE